MGEEVDSGCWLSTLGLDEGVGSGVSVMSGEGVGSGVSVMSGEGVGSGSGVCGGIESFGSGSG